MMRTRTWLGGVLVAGVAGLTACSGGSSPSSEATTTTIAAVTTTTPATTTSPSSGSTSSTTAPAAGSAPENLVITTDVRAQLLQAGAASHNLTAADYTGLAPGATYYAYDPTTKTYWAGAGLEPSPSSMPAQVANQDDGAYLLFERAGTGSWQVWNVGLAGTEGSTCPTVVPAGILSLWNWPPASCRPATIP